MALTDPVTIARWVIEAGFTGGDRAQAVAVAIATGADPAKSGGMFGIGGPAGDGPGQARHAKSTQAADGWDAFPAHRSGVDTLMLPIAVTAVATASAAGAVAATPAGQATGEAVSQAADTVSNVGSLTDISAALLNYASTENFRARFIKFMLGSALIVIGSAKLVSGVIVMPAVSKVGRIADTLIAGAVVKEKAQAATETIRRSSYRGRHSAEGFPIRTSAETEIARGEK